MRKGITLPFRKQLEACSLILRTGTKLQLLHVLFKIILEVPASAKGKKTEIRILKRKSKHFYIILSV